MATPPIRDVWAPEVVNGATHKNIQARTGNKLRGFAIHGTANLGKGANAAAHANLQLRGNVRVASWHATADDREVTRSWRKAVRCWHAGNGGLDYYSLEICVNADGDGAKAIRNAAAFVAWVHVHEGVPLVLKQHKDFTGKHCPSQIIDGRFGITWAQFVALVNAEVATLRGGAKPAPATPAPAPKPAAPAQPVGRNATKRPTVDIQRRVGVTPDGSYGPATTAAVTAFQRANNLSPDGIWGPLTDAKGFPPAAPKPAVKPTPAPTVAGPTLKKGSKGAAVRKLQTDLNRVFPTYSKLKVDGDFGAATRGVVVEFQRRVGLTPDGSVGPLTWAALAKHGIKP